MRVEKSAGEAGMHGGWQGGEADGDGGGGAHVCAHDEHDERDAHRGATAGVEGERQTESTYASRSRHAEVVVPPGGEPAASRRTNAGRMALRAPSSRALLERGGVPEGLWDAVVQSCGRAH